MKILSLIKKSCVWFSAFTVLYSLIVIAFSKGGGMNPISVFLLFPFSLFVVLADFVVKCTEWKKGVKASAHFCLLTTALVLFIFLPHGKMFSAQSTLVLLAIYCFIYAVGAIITSLVKSANLRKKEKSAEYKNVY